MSENDLEKIIESNSQKETVSTEIGIKAGLILAAIAEQNEIEWAFAGGIAMHIYGFDRATSDVDVVAADLLNLESNINLSFGGKSYQVEVGERQITVDWIVRNDEFAKFYFPALNAAVKIKNGIRIISPDWLVILKHLAGRPKDQIDLIWLLQENGLVNREKVVENIKSVLGEFAIYLINDLQSEFDYADVIKMRGERNKYE